MTIQWIDQDSIYVQVHRLAVSIVIDGLIKESEDGQSVAKSRLRNQWLIQLGLRASVMRLHITNP